MRRGRKQTMLLEMEERKLEFDRSGISTWFGGKGLDIGSHSGWTSLGIYLVVSFFLMVKMRAGDTAQSIKGLLCEHGALSLDL